MRATGLQPRRLLRTRHSYRVSVLVQGLPCPPLCAQSIACLAANGSACVASDRPNPQQIQEARSVAAGPPLSPPPPSPRARARTHTYTPTHTHTFRASRSLLLLFLSFRLCQERVPHLLLGFIPGAGVASMSEEELRAELASRVKALQRRSAGLASLSASEADFPAPGEQRLFRDVQALQVWDAQHRFRVFRVQGRPPGPRGRVYVLLRQAATFVARPRAFCAAAVGGICVAGPRGLGLRPAMAGASCLAA